MLPADGNDLRAAVLLWPDDSGPGHALILHTGDHCFHFFVIAAPGGLVFLRSGFVWCAGVRRKAVGIYWADN